MLKLPAITLAAAILACGAGAANADSCSGHGHAAGTVVGAVGGGLIGSAVTHGSAGGVIGGAVLGGLAGNQIARSGDCRHYHRHAYYYDRYHRRHYYE
jgi:uncharacterized protein YcfJ